MDSSAPNRPSFITRILKPRWQGMTIAGIIVAVLIGVAVGQSAYTFRYAEGLSYFSPNPEACVNCHIMDPQYAGWQKGSHHNVAVCIDCHLPHDFLGKYYTKAENGFWHSKGFTLQDFPEPIRLREVSKRVLQHSCLHCHEDFVHDILVARPEQEELDCIHCHRTVGHGESVGMGRLEPVTAEMLKEWGQHAQRK